MKKYFALIMLMCTSSCNASTQIDPNNIQQSLTYCSDNNLTCEIVGQITITKPVYIWGGASLTGGELIIDIDQVKEPYVINFGISGPSGGNPANNKAEIPWHGAITNTAFTVSGDNIMEEGRLLYFWRTEFAVISTSTFNLGEYRYSATTSGNHNGWLSGAGQYVRDGLRIENNTISANSNALGSEGFGLGLFNNAVFYGNHITGVGDDPIACHRCTNLTVKDNYIESVDGRIYASNSTNVEISGNTHKRIKSPKTNLFHRGIALIYIGFEIKGTTNWPAPQDTYIHHNDLIYPEGSIDAGAAINILGARDTVVERNYIENNSLGTIATALHILPQPMGNWSDPSGLDPNKVARVHNFEFNANISNGIYPLRQIMTGNCVDHIGDLTVDLSIAPSYQFYCQSVQTNNHTLN